MQRHDHGGALGFEMLSFGIWTWPSGAGPASVSHAEGPVLYFGEGLHRLSGGDCSGCVVGMRYVVVGTGV